MDIILAAISIAIMTIGLVGQAYEFRKIRMSFSYAGQSELPNIFLDKRVFKWYAVIGVGLAIWLLTEMRLIYIDQL